MKPIVKNVIVLTLITVVAGFLLGYVQDITSPLISEQKLIKKQQAYMKVYPDASSFEEDESLRVENSDSILDSAQFSNESISEVLAAKDSNGNILGYVLTVVTGEGYGGNISVAMGVSNEGTLKGIEILSISETAGLGMNADTDAFKGQFKDKTVSQFKYTKTGAQNEYEIDALSGATITTNAMVNAVNAGLVFVQSREGGVVGE